MKTAFIIHGVEGYPEENWFPCLRSELKKNNFQVIVPQSPTPEGQNLDNWLQVLENYHELINENTIFIGHSLGAVFTLNVLEKYKIKAAYLVAGYSTLDSSSQFYEGVKSFIAQLFDFEKIKNNCETFAVFHADNDPYFRLELGQELADKLETKLHLIKNAGHFNTKAGYDQFEELRNEILKEE